MDINIHNIEKVCLMHSMIHKNIDNSPSISIVIYSNNQIVKSEAEISLFFNSKEGIKSLIDALNNAFKKIEQNLINL